ncbi:hypothetical protein IE81DRAFT_167876 [Ceraceosorus guamensis]|uniref:Uncharacterized protein n=1 Tax=Ceraceosorus guamensis TaxID=1522189 RepID=A0A316W735_9BASI|nr:hypothetical protein IE81DRAFT_167876 [Ceraceosorus guamensis]PWN45756.1 hypothetical protein IE81DRAFT_167876 [Ceraceosorus guamensis]
MAGTKRKSAKEGQEQEAERGSNASSGSSKRIKESETSEQERKRASHLYTDDNPSTTLHGTSFKDAASAHRTIQMVSANRSLTYQFQTINTMLHRAKGHPSKTEGIKASIPIFQEWVDSYQSRKSALRSFKMLKKDRVARYLKYVDEHTHYSDKEWQASKSWAERYVALQPKQRLANTLMDEKDPAGEDLESHRYRVLHEIVPDVPRDAWQQEDLWADISKRIPSGTHLKMLLYAYSPLGNV